MSIDDVDGAVNDARKLSVMGQWNYVCTLSSDDEVSLAVRHMLDRLEKTRRSLEIQGVPCRQYTMQAFFEEE